MSKSNIEYLRHINEETLFIVEQLDSISEDDFIRSPVLKRAFIRSLEIIGEATKQISESLRNKEDNIDWKGMSRMRDKLIHHYFGIDYSIVWDVINNEIPVLNNKIFNLIKKEETNKEI